MKKMIKIYKSRTHEEILEKMLGSMRNLVNNAEDVVVIVPPVFSMTIESLIYEHLKEKVFFNFKVHSLTKFIDACFSGVFVESSDIISITVINKILEKQKNNFKWIKYNDKKTKLPNEFYKIITNFRANRINVDDLIRIQEKSKDEAFKAKMHDLILVYEEYIHEIKNKYPDLMSKREYFLETLKQGEIDLSRLNIFVIDLDEMSKIEGEIYKNLAEKSKNFEIGFLHDLKDSENTIFPNEKVTEFETLIKKTKSPYQIENIRKNNDAKIDFLLDNLFNFTIDKYIGLDSKLNIKIYEYENIEQEILGLCKKITGLLAQGYKLSDIEIAALQLDRYRESIKKYFLEFNIPFIIEEKNPLSKHIPFKFILDILNLIKNNYDIKIMHSIFLSPYSTLPLHLANLYVNTVLSNVELTYNAVNTEMVNILKGLAKEEEIAVIQKYFFEFSKILANIPKKKSKVVEFVNGIKNIIVAFDMDRISGECVDKYQDEHIKEAFILSLEKINDILDNMENIFDDVEITLESFINIFVKIAENTNISNAPITQNKIFIGDVHYSSFAVNKNVILIGLDNIAVLESLRINDMYFLNERDWNIISQETYIDINSISKYMKFIKLKLLQVLVKGRDNLIISYHVKNASMELRESTVIKEIKNYFNIEDEKIKIDITECLEIEKYKKQDDFSELLFNNDGNINISATILKDFSNCKLYCLLKDIAKIKGCVKDDNKTTIGNKIHQFFQFLYLENDIKKVLKQKNTDKETKDKIKKISGKVYDLIISETKKEVGSEETLSDLERYREEVILSGVESVISDIKSKLDIIEIEKVFQNIKFDYNDDMYVISGRADKIGYNNEKNLLKIVDYKTGVATFDNSEKGNGKILKDKQMELYLLAYLIKEIQKDNIVSIDNDKSLVELIERTNLERIELEYFHPVKKLVHVKQHNKIIISSREELNEDGNIKMLVLADQTKIALLDTLKKFKSEYEDTNINKLKKNYNCAKCPYVSICK